MFPKALRGAGSSLRFEFWLLALFLGALWFAGGASRGDAAGQLVTRLFAWTILILLAIKAQGIDWRPIRPVFAFFFITVSLVACQLIPLPPAVWSDIPGHQMLLRAAEVIGSPQPWRPLSISPSATANALASLVVPGTVLLLCANLSNREHWIIARIVVGLVLAGSVVALIQVSGGHYANPLINYVPGSVSGNFANRNHFALFLAIGCLLAAVISVSQRGPHRRLSLGVLLLIPIFALVVLAVGSRAGLVLTALAIPIGLSIGWAQIRERLRILPRLVVIGLSTLALVAVSGIFAAAIVLDRAESVHRAFGLEASADLRRQALPYIFEATQEYFPYGAGFGTFDPAYRIVEPDELLRLTYFNHAHNDWAETLLSGGLAGLFLLAAILVWFVASVWRVWRNRRSRPHLAFAGAGILLLFMAASLVDYPARTPMGMALIALAAVWLQRGRGGFAHSDQRGLA